MSQTCRKGVEAGQDSALSLCLARPSETLLKPVWKQQLPDFVEVGDYLHHSFLRTLLSLILIPVSGISMLGFIIIE